MMTIFELGWAIPVKSHVWKIGLDWLKSEVWEFSGVGEKPPVRGVTCDLQCPSSNLAELFQSKVCVKFWFGMVEPFNSYRVHKQPYTHKKKEKKKRKNHRCNWKQYASEKFFYGRIIKITDTAQNNIFRNIHSVRIIILTSKASQLWSARRGAYNNRNIWNSRNLPYLVANTYGLNFIKIEGISFFRGVDPLVGGGVTFDLWCPFSNSDEVFQSKVMCENRVWIGWNWRYVNFQRAQGGGRESKSPLLGGGGLHLTCDVHFRTWPSYFSQKSCVKIWFGLVEPFKSYRGNRRKKKKKKIRRDWKQYPSKKFASGR